MVLGQSRFYYSAMRIVRLRRGFRDGSAGIGAWKWGLDGSSATYFGLMPRSWTLYEGELQHYTTALLHGTSTICLSLLRMDCGGVLGTHPARAHEGLRAVCVHGLRLALL